jgi:hypothetical protein
VKMTNTWLSSKINEFKKTSNPQPLLKPKPSLRTPESWNVTWKKSSRSMHAFPTFAKKSSRK